MRFMHTGTQIHLLSGFWTSTAVGCLMVRRTASSQISHFHYALTASLLPLPRPTGVKPIHSTGHIFRGSSKACWREAPFKASPGSLCGMRSIETIPFPGKSQSHPTMFLFSFTQGSGHKWLGGCSAAPPCRQLRRRQEKPHAQLGRGS